MSQSGYVQVQVSTRHIDDHPVNSEGKYAFAYHVIITNHYPFSLQLINRYWLITDGNGKQQEVRGPGVVGNQPHIAPGQDYEYNSGAILETPVGSMQGFYEMQDERGNLIKAPIDVFSLKVSNLVN